MEDKIKEFEKLDVDELLLPFFNGNNNVDEEIQLTERMKSPEYFNMNKQNKNQIHSNEYESQNKINNLSKNLNYHRQNFYNNINNPNINSTNKNEKKNINYIDNENNISNINDSNIPIYNHISNINNHPPQYFYGIPHGNLFLYPYQNFNNIQSYIPPYIPNPLLNPYFFDFNKFNDLNILQEKQYMASKPFILDNINQYQLTNKLINNIKYENKSFNDINYTDLNRELQILKNYKNNIELINNKIDSDYKQKISLNNFNSSEDIIIYITSNNEIEFINNLNNIKAIKFKDIQLPKITIEDIKNRIKVSNYQMTKEDKLITKINNNNKLNEKIFYNRFIFYTKNKLSLYCPHIIKSQNNIISIFLTKNQKILKLSDFQYFDYHKYINDDIFIELLNKRINEYNNLIIKNKDLNNINLYNNKIYGFHSNISENNYYLYTIMDQEIISNKLNKLNYINLFNNLTGAESQINVTKTHTFMYETFNKNMDFLKGLTFEELILYIIIDKLDNKYEILPRILFYEYFMTINGDKIVVSDKIQPGYSEIDCVIYSNKSFKYEEGSPLIIQQIYNYSNDSDDFGEYFEIKENTLYFFELKSSFDFSIEETENNVSKAEQFLKILFNNYKEFLYLYESNEWITKDTNKEIILIYDNEMKRISNKFESMIKDFVNKNKDCTFKIIYSVKSYPYFSHSLAISKYQEISKENSNLKLEIEAINKKLNELYDKYELKKNNNESKDNNKSQKNINIEQNINNIEPQKNIVIHNEPEKNIESQQNNEPNIKITRK